MSSFLSETSSVAELLTSSKPVFDEWNDGTVGALIKTLKVFSVAEKTDPVRVALYTTAEEYVQWAKEHNIREDFINEISNLIMPKNLNDGEDKKQCVSDESGPIIESLATTNQHIQGLKQTFENKAKELETEYETLSSFASFLFKCVRLETRDRLLDIVSKEIRLLCNKVEKLENDVGGPPPRDKAEDYLIQINASARAYAPMTWSQMSDILDFLSARDFASCKYVAKNKSKLQVCSELLTATKSLLNSAERYHVSPTQMNADRWKSVPATLRKCIEIMNM